MGFSGEVVNWSDTIIVHLAQQKYYKTTTRQKRDLIYNNDIYIKPHLRDSELR